MVFERFADDMQALDKFYKDVKNVEKERKKDHGKKKLDANG